MPLNAYCASCGVPQFAPRSLHGPFVLRGQEDRRTAARQGSITAGLSARNRKIVGGAQALAGATVLLVLGTVPGGLIPTSWMELWRVGFATFALVGGVALYRGDPRGHALTRIVLAAQLLNFVVPGVVWRVQAGFFIGPTVGSGLVDMGAGWNSTFQLWLGATTGWEIKVNLLAFWLLTLIPRGEGAGHGALTALGD